MAQERRGEWGSRVGFVLAAAGSAVGLGNVWKFPYITGENGGGLFVIIYLVCILFVGLPIMIGEVMLGRMTQRSPVGAFAKLGGERSLWKGVGWVGVLAGFVILSYYSVVAGWALEYTVFSASGAIDGADPAVLAQRFGQVAGNGSGAILWHVAFMAVTIAIVIGGVQKGVEIAARVLMPLLLLMFVALLIFASQLDGFGQGVSFVFGLHTDNFGPGSVLEALGHSFFTLSVGMGAMLTYGSYLKKDDDIVVASVAITVIDTMVALMACLVLFPITFTYAGMEPAAGPSLVFQNIPIALSELPGSTIWAVTFFLLLVFAALTSAISLLEVTASYFIDELGWSRTVAVPVTGGVIIVLGIPSALAASSHTFGAGMEAAIGMNWFDLFDYVSSNWMLPLCGLGISLFAAWKLGDEARRVQFAAGSSLGKLSWLYVTWLQVLRWVVPIAIVLIMLHALKVFELLGLTGG